MVEDNLLHKLFVEAEKYDASDRKDKMIITMNIANEVKDWGGRFLQMNSVSGTWEEVSEKEVLRKISHAFRNARR